MPVVVVGMLALAGYVTVRRALDATIDTTEVDPAIDVTEIKAAVEENGLRAVAETETLESAINEDELDTPIDIQELRSTVEETVVSVEAEMDADGNESVLGADELDTVAPDRGLSAIADQEIIEGTMEDGEIGISVDTDELRSIVESGTTVLERMTGTVAKKVDANTDVPLLDSKGHSMEGGHRIAVVDEEGDIESLIDDDSTVSADS